MYKFRNPGTNLNTLINNFNAFYNELKDNDAFGLEEMASVLAKNMLMTSRGFSGEQALSRSYTKNISRNPTQMNVKMYAEVLRMMGWISSKTKEKSYPLVFTYFGIQVANSCESTRNRLYAMSVLGIVNPNEILNVKYNEKTRLFKSILQTAKELDGYIYKHEMCMLPMSHNDDDPNLKEKISLCNIQRHEMNYSEFKSQFAEFANKLGMKISSVDNCTRIPIAMLKQSGLVKEDKRIIYGRKLKVFKITELARNIIKNFHNYADMRLKDFYNLDKNEQKSAIRLGYLNLMEDVGLDVSLYSCIKEIDKKKLQYKLKGRRLFFSPYQTLRGDQVTDVLSNMFGKEIVINTNQKYEIKNENNNYIVQNKILTNNFIVLRSGTDQLIKNQAIDQIVKEIQHMSKQTNPYNVINILLKKYSSYKQSKFYPLVGHLLEIIGLNCHVSRAGDNGARWDAIIVDKNNCIPIEIKSPTEEINVSLKAIRQALENKIVLLSRKTYPTRKEDTSMVIGYQFPNERSEMNELIEAIKNTYGFKISVLDLKTIIYLVIEKVINGKTVCLNDLTKLEGIVSVNSIQRKNR